MSSDFIVGFPGETEEDFNKMMKLIDDIHFPTTASASSSAPPQHARRKSCPTTRRTM